MSNDLVWEQDDNAYCSACDTMFHIKCGIPSYETPSFCPYCGKEGEIVMKPSKVVKLYNIHVDGSITRECLVYASKHIGATELAWTTEEYYNTHGVIVFDPAVVSAEEARRLSGFVNIFDEQLCGIEHDTEDQYSNDYMVGDTRVLMQHDSGDLPDEEDEDDTTKFVTWTEWAQGEHNTWGREGLIHVEGDTARVECTVRHDE